MPGTPSGVAACAYTSNEAWTVEQQLQQLDIHQRAAHPAPAGVGGGAAGAVKQEKPGKPVLQMAGMHCEEQSWDFFKHEWGVYKALCGIQVGQVNARLQDCLPTEVRMSLHGHFGSNISNQTE